jgi:hypothetical protein
MWQRILAITCVALALTLALGCGGQNTAGNQPKLANPDDPKVKDLAPIPVGGGPKGAGGKANPF